MSHKLVIAQVTDLHIGSSDVLYRGLNGRKQFVEVLQVLAKTKLDLLVLSGDLAASEGEPEAYAWLRQVLTTFPYPYVVMAGNHDHAVRMKRAFDLADSDVSQGMLYFSRTIKGKRLLFLDSSFYRIPKQQLEWLNTQLADYKKPTLLFVHHPPLLCECLFMDECHCLRNIDEVWRVLDQLPQIEHIFCGHYHADKTVLKNGKSVHLTPSTIFQIDTENPQFAIKHNSKPGWRMIEWVGNKVQTYAEYL